MHRLIQRLAVVAVALAVTSTPLLAVVPHVVIIEPEPVDGATCRIGVGTDPGTLPQVGAVSVMPMSTSDGETGFEGQCGVADTFFFGAGLSEYFAAHAAATSICVGKVGVLRAFGIALAETFPESYGPPFPAEGTNILSASAAATAGGFFVDVITPPPTSAAPHPGDPTELILTPVLDVDCGHYSNAYQEGSLIISFWAPDAYTDDANFSTPGFIYSTGLMRPGIPKDVGCSYGGDPRTITGLEVGQPVVMRVNFGVTPFMQRLASQSQFGSYAAELSALSTATALLATTDGDPVTGASGHTYTAVDPLPDLMVPTTTTTILPTPTTTTTLPGCGGMCGNGVVDASCGEACDCPPTADPIAAAYGCTGASIRPAHPDCVVCRGCQLMAFCPSSVTTTTTVPTTTLPGASTTTTSTVSTTTLATSTVTTTTTAAALPCAGLSGSVRARCQLTAALAQPLCGVEDVPPAADRALRTKLGAADAALGSLATTTGKRARKLQHRAVSDLVAAGARAAQAAKTKSPRRHVSATCAATVRQLTGELVQEITNP